MKQLSARSVTPRDVPNFSGDPKQWPLFIAAFVNTTACCGFSNDENLVRLQKALNGEALEAVRSKLLILDTVNDVLNMLKMLYGRPKVILQSLMVQVRKELAVHPEKIDDVVKYGLVVLRAEPISSTIEVAGMTEYCMNPTWLYEL